MSRPPRISNWLPWRKSTISFVTFCVTNRLHVLANHRAWSTCRATFARLDQWTILSAPAMPDHMHALISPPGDRDASISGFAKWFQRWFNQAFWNCRPSVPDGRQRTWQWQEGCLTDCFAQMSRCLRNGNTSGKIRSVLVLSPILMSGHINISSMTTSRPSLRDGV